MSSTSSNNNNGAQCPDPSGAYEPSKGSGIEGTVTNTLKQMFTTKAGLLDLGLSIVIIELEKEIIMMVIKDILIQTTGELAAEAAVESWAGPIGWFLLAFQVLTAVLDIWDPQGYEIVLDRHTLNEAKGGGITGKIIDKTRTLMEQKLCLKNYPHQVYWKNPSPPLKEVCKKCVTEGGKIAPTPTETGKAAEYCKACNSGLGPKGANVDGLFDIKDASELQLNYLHSQLNFAVDYVLLNIKHYQEGGTGTITPTKEQHKKLYVGQPSDLKKISSEVQGSEGKYKTTVILVGIFILIATLISIFNAKNKMSALMSAFISLIAVLALFLIAARRNGIWPYTTKSTEEDGGGDVPRPGTGTGTGTGTTTQKKKMPPKSVLKKWSKEAKEYADKMLCEGCVAKQDVITKKYIIDCSRKPEVSKYRKWQRVNINGKPVYKCVLTQEGCNKYSFYPYEGLEGTKIDAPKNWDMSPQYLEWQPSNVDTNRNPYVPDDVPAADIMGGYCRQGHSMVRHWCTATKSKMRQNKDGSPAKGMYGTAPFKYYPDGTCTDTYDYCTQAAPIGKAVEYDPETENCYVSTEEKIFYMIFGKTITDNVVGGFRYAANLSAYGIGWLNKEGLLPSGLSQFMQANSELLLLALGPPPAQFFLSIELGQLAWHDRRKIMADAEKSIKAVKNTLEDASDCVSGAVGNEAAMKKCKGLINSIENDGKVVAAYIKKWGLEIAHGKAAKQMKQIETKGITDLKKTYRSLRHFTENEIKAAHKDILKFGNNVKNDAEKIASGVKNLGKHVGHDVVHAAHHIWHDISSWF
jgi:hypothetical protein